MSFAQSPTAGCAGALTVVCMAWVGGGQSHCVTASHNVSNMLLIGNYNEKTSPQLTARKKMSKEILLSLNSWWFFIPRVASCCLS